MHLIHIHLNDCSIFKVFLLTYLSKLNKEDAVDRSRWRKLIKDVWWTGWAWVGECFFWYRSIWLVPDKGPLNGCVCVCVYLLNVCVARRLVSTRYCTRFHTAPCQWHRKRPLSVTLGTWLNLRSCRLHIPTIPSTTGRRLRHPHCCSTPTSVTTFTRHVWRFVYSRWTELQFCTRVFQWECSEHTNWLSPTVLIWLWPIKSWCWFVWHRVTGSTCCRSVQIRSLCALWTLPLEYTCSELEFSSVNMLWTKLNRFPHGLWVWSDCP